MRARRRSWIFGSLRSLPVLSRVRVHRSVSSERLWCPASVTARREALRSLEQIAHSESWCLPRDADRSSMTLAASRSAAASPTLVQDARRCQVDRMLRGRVGAGSHWPNASVNITRTGRSSFALDGDSPFSPQRSYPLGTATYHRRPSPSRRRTRQISSDRSGRRVSRARVNPRRGSGRGVRWGPGRRAAWRGGRRTYSVPRPSRRRHRPSRRRRSPPGAETPRARAGSPIELLDAHADN